MSSVSSTQVYSSLTYTDSPRSMGVNASIDLWMRRSGMEILPESAASLGLTVRSTTALATQLLPEFGAPLAIVLSRGRWSYLSSRPRTHTTRRDRAARYCLRTADILRACSPHDYVLVAASWTDESETPASLTGRIHMS